MAGSRVQRAQADTVEALDTNYGAKVGFTVGFGDFGRTGDEQRDLGGEMREVGEIQAFSFTNKATITNLRF